MTAAYAYARKKRDQEKARNLKRRQARLPIGNCDDPGYRRLRYVRYADDTLFGFAGPKAEAEEIKQRLTQFMRDDLHLELSGEKTLITHARTGAAKFLGYEITTQHNTSGRKNVNGVIGLRVPRAVIKAKSLVTRGVVAFARESGVRRRSWLGSGRVVVPGLPGLAGCGMMARAARNAGASLG